MQIHNSVQKWNLYLQAEKLTTDDWNTRVSGPLFSEISLGDLPEMLILKCFRECNLASPPR